MREELAESFSLQAFVCSTEERLICVLQETASNMADYEVLRSLPPSIALTHLFALSLSHSSSAA